MQVPKLSQNTVMRLVILALVLSALAEMTINAYSQNNLHILIPHISHENEAPPQRGDFIGK